MVLIQVLISYVMILNVDAKSVIRTGIHTDTHTGGGSHAEVSASGAALVGRRLSPDEESALAFHQDKRNQHCASDPELQWDTGLASDMLDFLDSSAFPPGHDPTLSGVGENLAMGGGGISVTAAVNMWYSEVTNCGDDFSACQSFNTATGHFTAMVWKGVRRLGCALSSDGRSFGCRYSPAPNMQDDYANNVFRESDPNCVPVPVPDQPNPVPPAGLSQANPVGVTDTGDLVNLETGEDFTAEDPVTIATQVNENTGAEVAEQAEEEVVEETVDEIQDDLQLDIDCPPNQVVSEDTNGCVPKPWSDFQDCDEEVRQGACADGNAWVAQHCKTTCSGAALLLEEESKTRRSSASSRYAKKLLQKMKDPREKRHFLDAMAMKMSEKKEKEFLHRLEGIVVKKRGKAKGKGKKDKNGKKHKKGKTMG